jgi:hypothetical protein
LFSIRSLFEKKLFIFFLVQIFGEFPVQKMTTFQTSDLKALEWFLKVLEWFLKVLEWFFHHRRAVAKAEINSR